MEELLFAPIAELRDLYARHEVSPVEVLDAVLARLDRLEPELNAFVTVLDGPARRQAERAERDFLRGVPAAPLAGIPVSVKDLIAIPGVRMTAGSRILRDHRPDRGSAVHAALRSAGAVVFGTANLLEFAYGFVHADHGQANNPWDVGRTAGGSSSGSVAAGIGHASIGTDTGGSVRLPAAFCGLVGLRPTHGAIDMAGVLPLAPSLDTVGVLARTPADARLVHEVLAGPQPAPPAPVRSIGVVADLLGEPLTPQVRKVFDHALDVLARAGARCREVRLPGIEEFTGQVATTMLAEAAHEHRAWYPARAADYAAGTRANLAAGRDVTATAYLHAMDERRRFTGVVDAALREVDLLAAPTIGFTAPEREPDFEGGGLGYVLRTMPFSGTGHPAVNVPAGVTADGLPAGLQLVARHGREADLLAAAEMFEREVAGFPRSGL
ncbi:amidase [Actinomadura violacea]|uniref:Amidase n=1 Tax=Actinomadura violacea TaxID=2819934 RepID=A0ABS3RZ64_9ACTN|nr:amidase [Actinomadura violacea]MBO2462046.1 amidase [Actinomadura violacea]